MNGRAGPGARGSVRASLVASVAQPHWNLNHATWFTLMGVGGGIFLLARLLGLVPHLGVWLGLPVVDLLSFTVVNVGGLVLLVHLGRPLRALYTVLRPRTSWISRGAIADFIFLIVGGLLVLPGLKLGTATPFAWLPWDAWAASPTGRLLELVALLSAAVVIFYAGQVLGDTAAIPYWNSSAIPLQFTLSSLAMALAVLILLQHANAVPVAAGQFWLLLAFLVLLLAAIAWHVGTETRAPGKAESLEALLRGRFRSAFLGGVVGAGTLLPIVLALLAAAVPRARGAAGVLAVACTVAGGFALRLITLRVGIHPPIAHTLAVPRR